MFFGIHAHRPRVVSHGRAPIPGAATGQRRGRSCPERGGRFRRSVFVLAQGRASGERLGQGAMELPLPGHEQWWFDARPRIGQESWVPLMPCATSANSLVEVTSPCRSAPLYGRKRSCLNRGVDAGTPEEGGSSRPSGFAYGVEVVRARRRRRGVGPPSLPATPVDPPNSQLASNRSIPLAAGHARHRDESWHGPCVRGHRPGGYIIHAEPVRLLAPRPRGSSSDAPLTDLRVALRVREATRVSGHEGCHGGAA